MSFSIFDPIQHNLAPHYSALRAIRRRRTLLQSALYREIGAEIERVTRAVERARHASECVRAIDGLRVVAWNIQRGRHLDALIRTLREDPRLRPDVLCLSEVDCGMGRSGNRHVARELAAALGMSYVYGVSYLVLEDDFGENPDGASNTLALAGQAVLSRVPIRRVENVDLPELRDKFSSSEKRLGKKRALLCELELSDGPLTVAACHLDSNASPAQRALQLGMLLDRAETFGVPRILIGGDLNSTTYDVSSSLGLAKNILHKLLFVGFRGAIAQYMTPEEIYERPLFEELSRRQFVIDSFNDRGQGTLHFDLHDPYAIQKTRRNVGYLLTWLLQRLLRPWNGRVPARLDWFAGRHLRSGQASTVEGRDSDRRLLSDHAAIVVELKSES